MFSAIREDREAITQADLQKALESYQRDKWNKNKLKQPISDSEKEEELDIMPVRKTNGRITE